MQRNERVLLVGSAKAIAARAARRVLATGDEAISGIVLAAQMMRDARMAHIEFFIPADELLDYDEPLSGVRSTSGRVGAEQMRKRVA